MIEKPLNKVDSFAKRAAEARERRAQAAKDMQSKKEVSQPDTVVKEPQNEETAEERRRTQAMLRSISNYIDQGGKALSDTVTQVRGMMRQRPTSKKPTSLMPSVGKVEMGAPTTKNTEEDPLSKSIVDSYSKQDKRVAAATEEKKWWEKGIEYVEKALNPTQFAARTVANWTHEQNNTPTSTWEERLSYTVEDTINQLPQDKDGKYIFNGASYSRDLLTPLVEDYAKEVLHPYMIATDPHYQDNYAQSLGYADRNAMFEAYKKPLEEMRAELKEEQKAANKEAFDYYAENPTYDGGDSYIATLMGNKMAAKTNGIQAIDDAIDMINAMQKGTLASGFKEGFNLDDFASLGVVGLVSDIKLLSVYNKLKDGEELTPTEERMLKISQITEELSMYKDANTTTMQSIGEGLGTTAEALPQVAPVMGVASKVANLGKVGVRAGVNLVKRAAREGVAKGVMEGLKQTGRVGKNVAINIARANVGGLVVAPLQTGTYTKYLENRQNQFSFKDGKLIYTPNAAWKDMYTAIVDQMNEVSSEILGAGIGKVTDFTFKGLGKVFGLDKAINGISSKVGLGASYDKIFGVKKGAAFRAMERAVGYAGDPVAEAFSEIYGDISSNIMKMGITDAEGNSVSDFSMLSDPKYWATNLAVAGVFGLTTTMANTARNIPVYSKISDLGKVKRKAINNIADKGLADALRMTGVDMDINASAQRLADYIRQRNRSTEGKLPRITQKDITHAMDYIRAEATQQVMLGVNEQNKDLTKFARVSADIENRAYRGEKGDVETTYIVEGVLEDGSKVNVISGNIEETPSAVVEVTLEDGTNVEVESKSGEAESEGDILMVMDEQGKIVPMAKSKVTITHRGKVSDKVAWEYQNMFNTQSLMLEVSSDVSTFEALEAPTEEDVNTLMDKMGIAQPEMHDEVTLVDGRKGLFVGWGAEGKMDVEVQSQDGSIELLSVPFFQILSSMSHYAEAQRLYFGIKTVNMAENELEAEERKAEAVGSSTTNAEVNGIAKGAIVNTPNGVAQVVAIDGDKVTVDYAYKDSAGKAELMDTEEVSLSDISEVTEPTSPNAEVVPEAGIEVTAEATAPEAPATEAVEPTEDVEAAQNEVAGIEKIPMTEDGNIDFDAIDDPKLFADLYKKEAGSVEAAIADVTEARNATEAKMQESIAKGKKSTSMNERNANRKEREALAQRVAFYDSVLNELAPKEAVAEDTQTENVEPAATEPSSTTEARETESANTTSEKAAEKKAGVIENKHSENINEALLKTIDRIAKMLGVTVEFQPVVMEDGRRVNGMIKDGHVIMATEVASQAPSWLAGHEFLHRMKELAPEQYEKFVQSVKDFMGEDLWQRRIDAQRALYIKNRFFEKAKDDDLMTEECAADFLGDMVEQADAFNEYLDSIQNEPVVLRFIHRAIDAIKRVLTGKKKSRLTKMQEQVNALITAAEKANAEGVKPKGGKAKTSVIGEQGEAKYSVSSAPVFYSNAQYAVQNIKQEKATPEQWLKMIEKNGGLKAGEDKWLGLSDWLKASDKKTLTKDEVLQYIAENDIQIEEVEYGDIEDNPRFKELEKEYQSHYSETYDTIISFERMAEKYGEDFELAFEASGMNLYPRNEYGSEDAQRYLGVNEINSTRRQYTTDGLTNKREIALTVPTIEPWNTSDNIHFGDAGEGRAVAWIRFGEATDADGKRVLVIDEIQSKRHQDGREKGYRDVEAEKREKAERERELTEVVLPRLGELNRLYNEKYGVGKWRDTEYDRQWRPRRVYRFLAPEEQAEHESLSIRATELQTTMPRRSGIPSAPFEKNWAELAFKRMLRYAAENGYDYVAWTTGDQQADRYDIGSVVKDIVTYDTKDADGNPIKKMKFRMNNMGTYNIATNMEGVIVKGDGEMKEGMRLSDITGKALAEKIMNGEGEDAMVFENGKDIEAKSLEGEELHIGNEGMKAFYDQMLPSFVKKYTKKWGAEVGEVTMPALEENNTMHAVNVTDSMRESVMQGQPKFSLAGAEVGFILENYDDIQDIATAVEAVVKRYPKDSGMLANVLSDYRQNADDDEFIQGLRTFAKYFGDKQERDRSEGKATIEETFGGIWIEDTEEFAKFAKAVNNTPFEENGEGVAYTDNYFYAYYRSIDGQPIPFASVYMNEYESQDIVNEILRDGREKKTAREWFDWFNAHARNVKSKNDAVVGSDKKARNTRTNGRLDSELSRYGAYYDSPELFVKSKRTNKGSRINYSLITPEMDASYLDAVERGDMETAQKMVMEAAEKAGFINDESWRMNHRAPRKDEENANPFNTEKIVPEDFWEHPEWYTNIRHSSEARESYYAMKPAIDKYKRLMAEGKTEEAENVTITMYRGVDKTANKREASFRNGDWITPSRSYALLSAPYRKARVISQEVKLKDIWWDGNSIDEWGYDDGANYGYRDTKNNRKLLDPVTYDDAGNVIPLSERFNPRKEDVRYSLSNRPTGLFNDFAEEFEALQKWYESLDTTTIHAQHPFRIRKRKVVQKYLNYVSEVLGLPCEVFVLDSSNEQQMRTAYRKYVSARLAGGNNKVSLASYNEFKEEVSDAIGEYFHGTNLVVINIGLIDAVNINSEYIGAVIHENGHKIIEGMNISEEIFEAIYEEAKRLASKQAERIEKRYKDATAVEKGEEVITFALQTRAALAPYKDMFMQFFEGDVSSDEILDSFKISLPLRDKIIKDILIALRDGYNNKHNADYSNNRDNYGAAQEEAFGNRRGSEHLRPTSRGGLLSDDTRYALSDMPFFSDEGGDVIIFDDTAEAFTRDSRPVVTEDTLRSYIDGRHYAATQRIRKDAADMKAVARLRLQEERRRRSDGIASQRTNVGKVDYILGDTSRESLSYVDQALVMIAEGSVHILWGKDKNGRNGLAAELGYRDGDKKAFRQITQGATQSFEGFVHSWWEAIGGYESGVDTQDLRNALIEALSEASKASTALSILREKFDAPQREYDDAIADIEANVDRELALEDARYNDEVAEFEGGEDKAKLIRYYEQNAIFHDDLTSVAYTIRDLERKLERATREASKARARGTNNAETLRNLRGNIAEAREAIAQVVRDSKVLKYNRREVQAIVNSVESARTANALKVALGRIENLILNIRIREERNNMQRLLNMRLPNGQLVETWVGNQVREGKMTPTDAKRIMADMWRGVDSRGVKVAKFVDPHTQAVMTFLRNELVMPIAKKGVVNTENEDGTTTRSFTTEREVTEPIDALRAANDVARAEIINNAASAGRSLTSQEQVELDARELYDHYLSVAEYKQQLIKNQEEIIALKELKRELDNSILEAEYSGALTEDARNHRASIIAQLGAVYASRMEIKRNYESRLMELNERIGNILAGGRDALKAFREGKEQHRQEVVNIALNAIGGTKALQNPNPPTAMQKVAAKVRGSVHDPYWTFETACREIDRWAPNGEGDFFNHFMGGYMEASNGFASRQVAHYTQLGDVIHRLWREHRHKSAYNAFVEIMREADTHVVGTLVYNTQVDAEGMSYHPEKLELRISNAMFVIAMWRQKQYQATMAKYGITQERIDELEAAIERVDGRYIEFMNYINDVFLPDTRLEYDEVHKKMFGASMDAIENYFPAKVVRNYEEVDVANQVDGALPSTITRSIISRKAHGNQPDYTQSYFGMLLSHIQDMDHWASFAPLTEDINAVLSNSEFKKRLNEYMSGVNNDRTGKGSLYQIFRTRCAIAVDAFTPKTTIADEILRNATRYWAASNISWRFSTALKQLSAAPIFAAYALNPKCLAIWTKNIAVGIVPMMGLFEWANENSPSFRQRWATKNAGNEKLSQRMREIAHGVENRSKVGNVWESVNDFIHKLATEWGITPNAAVDAWVCATGMKTIYEFEISKVTKGQREATEEEKQSAMRKAEIFMNTTQQSAESAYLSEVQMQKSLITTVITNYMNASYALHRLRVGGAQELGRGLFNRKYRRMVIDKYGEEALSENNKKAMARILQGVIGDVTFYLAGIGLKNMWALIAGVDDDEDEKGKDFTDMSLLEKIAFICKVPAQIALNGFLGGNLISNYLQGYEVSVTTPMDALLKMVGEFIDVSENKDTGEMEWAIDWWAGASLVTKFGYGVDLKTMLNIAEGVAEIDTAEGVMKIFNEPRSSINFVAGRRREGETVKQYVERRMHLEIIFSEPSFEDMFDEEGNYIGKGKIPTMFGLTDKQIKGFLKEYKERQARAVLDASDYAKYENIDAEYTEVCEKMGWKPEKDPKDPKVDKSADPSKNKTKKGMWIYPEDLKAHQYNRVKKAATLAADKSREVDRFIGTDEGYKQLLEQEYDLKSNVINVYNEL